MTTINLQQKFDLIQTYWHPHVVADLNGQQVKLVKLKGEFIWHSHEHEDELFMVVHGKLVMEFRDRVETVNAGEMIVVPRGVEHRPVAAEEVCLILFEPAGTVNTGAERNHLTRQQLPRI